MDPGSIRAVGVANGIQRRLTGQSERAQAMIKLTFCLKRKPDLTREKFRKYWLENHAPLVRSVQDDAGNAFTFFLEEYQVGQRYLPIFL